MSKIFHRSTLAGIAGVVLFLTLSSFILRRGGDSYTISLNGKPVIQYYVHSKETLPTLTLNAGTQDVLAVYYSECGKIGTARKLSLRDAKNNILKEWKFENALGAHTAMTINTKDMVAKVDIGLYYTSEASTTPRKLVNLTINNRNTASR